jgi:DNA mismatch repair protein MutL
VAEQVAFYRQPLTPAGRPARVAAAAPATTSTHLLAVAHGNYLLLQRSGEPGVLAVTAARQLLLARRLGDALASGEIPGQPLLFPATVRLEAGQIERLEHNATTLLRLGVVVERLGEEALVVRQLPLLLRGVEPARLIHACYDFFARSPDVDSEREAFIQGVAGLLAPLLPPADMETGAVLLRELEQLLRDGGLGEGELPWRPLSEERLAALFTTTI